MGRMFDTLRQADAPTEVKAPERIIPLRDTPKFEDAVDAAPEIDEELDYASEAPFIEVGPNRSIEASPGLLDAPVAPSKVLAEEVRVLPLEPVVVSATPLDAKLPVDTPAVVRRPRIAADLVAYYRPENAASLRYGDMLTAMIDTAPANRAPAFLLTPAMLDAGATTAVLNLAIMAARQGRGRVVVVDANLRHPAVAVQLGLEEAPGLRDVLNAAVPLDEAIQETQPLNVYALTAGSRTPVAGPRLVAATMRSLIRDLRRRFDLVLVDGPRWTTNADVLAAGLACDAVYVVAPESERDSALVDQILEAIPDQGARLGGCVVTM